MRWKGIPGDVKPYAECPTILWSSGGRWKKWKTRALYPEHHASLDSSAIVPHSYMYFISLFIYVRFGTKNDNFYASGRQLELKCL